MKNSIKQTLGAAAMTALAAMTIGMVKAAPIETGQLLIKAKPTPPSVEKGKSATIPVEPPTVESPATEKGIKDNAVKGCGNCGVTGREAAPPPVDDGAAPAPSVDIETGQKLDKPQWPYNKATERRAHNGPGGTPPTGAVARPKTGWIIPTLAVAAAAGGIVAVSSGNDKPVSP